MSETSEIDIEESGGKRRENVASAGLDPETWDELEAWRQEEGIAYRSDAVRRLIRAGLDREKQKSLRLRIVTFALFVLFTGFPTYLAYTGNITLAVGWIVLAAVADTLSAVRGGRSFIQV